MEEKSEENFVIKPKGFGIRHVQAVLLFFGLSFSLAIRTNLSVAIVAMTDKESNPNFEVFDWGPDIKGFLLSSFFWGYVVIQLPAGYIAHMFGGKMLLFIAVFGSSLFTVIVPPLASLGWEYVFATRVINGLFQGCVYPSIYTLMAKWVHPTERSIAAIIVTGNTFGIFFMMIISGEIAASSLGWPGIFYISGGFGIIWSALWIWFGSDSPGKSNSISSEELQYLQKSSGTTSHEKLPIPWIQIFTSLPFISVMISHSAHTCGYYTLMTETPAYIKDILHFDIKASAILASLPYLVMLIVTAFICPLSDVLINRNYLTRTVARKVFNSFGHWAPAACLIALGFFGHTSAEMAMTLLILAVGFNSGVHAGFQLSHIDMSPNFSGTLYSITNCIANIFSMLGPIFVGLVVTDPEDPELWKIVFVTTSVFYIIGNLIYVIFASGDIQKWNIGRIPSKPKQSI